MSEIDDPDVARAILTRVNDLNVQTILVTLAASVAFASLPEATTTTASYAAILFTVLYFLRDRIPEDV